MTCHDVKIEPRWFERIRTNEKFAEVRYDDRDYQTGDRIRFKREDCDGTLGWHYTERTITHVLRACDGLEDGYVVLSLADPRVADYRDRWQRQIEESERIARSNRTLRGQITKLKQRIDGAS